MGIIEDALIKAGLSLLRSVASSGILGDEGEPQAQGNSAIAPFPETNIKPGEFVDIVWRPQRPMHVKAMVLSVPSGNGENVSVQSLDVGSEPQFLSGGDVPVALYAAGSTIPAELRGTVAGPNTPITLRVKNSSPHTAAINGCVVGPLARDSAR